MSDIDWMPQPPRVRWELHAERAILRIALRRTDGLESVGWFLAAARALEDASHILIVPGDEVGQDCPWGELLNVILNRRDPPMLWLGQGRAAPIWRALTGTQTKDWGAAERDFLTADLAALRGS